MFLDKTYKGRVKNILNIFAIAADSGSFVIATKMLAESTLYVTA